MCKTAAWPGTQRRYGGFTASGGIDDGGVRRGIRFSASGNIAAHNLCYGIRRFRIPASGNADAFSSDCERCVDKREQ